MLQQNFKKITKYSVKLTLMNKKWKLIKYSSFPHQKLSFIMHPWNTEIILWSPFNSVYLNTHKQK